MLHKNEMIRRPVRDRYRIAAIGMAVTFLPCWLLTAQAQEKSEDDSSQPLIVEAKLISPALRATIADKETGSAGASAAQISRPAYNLLRYKEDWSVLKGVTDADRTDPWGPIKYVPLGEGGDFWASFDPHMRLRLEDWSDFAFGTPGVADDTFLLWRLMAHGDFHCGKNARVVVEGKSALATDRELPGGRRAALIIDVGGLVNEATELAA